jgi:hypothetical protein
VLAIITAFVTADFRDALSFKAAVWEAVFLITGVGSFLWLVVAGFRCWRSPTVEDVVEKIKSQPALAAHPAQASQLTQPGQAGLAAQIIQSLRAARAVQGAQPPNNP